ncbi:hypothetical protein FRC12_018596 [Ceratobasidium sp. 428]|nr:hypothetical protein FRC12_018596 [Ceratobasidium sp. 428]
MIKRIKRRIHRVGEKLDRLLGSDERAIPSPQASTALSPEPIRADTSAQLLLDSALPQSRTIDNGLGLGLSPTPPQVMDQESSAIPPNHELTQVESHSKQAPVTVPESQTEANLVPSRETNTSKLHTAWSGLRSLLNVLDKSADAFEPLKSAVGGLVACLEIYEGQVVARQEYQQLKIDLESASREIAGYLGGAAPPSMESSILKLAQDIKEEVELVNRKTQRNTLERYAEATAEADEILARYRRIQRHLDAFAWNRGRGVGGDNSVEETYGCGCWGSTGHGSTK